MEKYRGKRVTLFVGHYGSGKTNIAVNYAKLLKSKGYDVVLADMDIVNPYFRAKDNEKELKRLGIDLVSSAYANSNVDIPALPSELYGVLENRSRYAVLDIGGDDRGALALGRFVPMLLEENDYDMLFVANDRRPLTRTPSSAMEVLREIEQACGVKVTGLVNNSNLGEDTEIKTVLASRGFIEELSRLSGLPVSFTALSERFRGKAEGLFKRVLYLDLIFNNF